MIRNEGERVIEHNPTGGQLAMRIRVWSQAGRVYLQADHPSTGHIAGSFQLEPHKANDLAEALLATIKDLSTPRVK